MPALSWGVLKRRIMLRAGNRIDNIRAGILLNEKLAEWSESYSFSWLKGDGVLNTVAPKGGGTLSLNADPTKFDGVGTSFASTDVGSYVRIAQDVPFFRVTAVVGQQLTVEVAYVGGTFTAKSYSLFRHIYSLPSTFRRFISPAFWAQLQEATLGQLDQWDALRSQSDIPSHFAYRGQDSSGAQQVEIWPVPSSAISIRYSFLKLIPDPTDDAFVVPMQPTALIYSCAADALYAVIAEAPSPQAVQHLIPLADKYEAKGLQALAEARKSDSVVAGVPAGVRDYRTVVWANDLFLNSHDVWSP